MSDIDWEAFKRDLPGMVASAGKRTDDKLANRVSSLTRLTDAEIKELFPTPADVEKLASLMAIVRSADDRNAKVSKLATNIESLAGTVITLVGKLA